jgi:hypothetical protein
MAIYTGNDNQGVPKSEYLDRVARFDDSELLKEAKAKIWLSAFANNNPRSDYHWHVDAIYDECQKRQKPEIYQQAYDYNIKNI